MDKCENVVDNVCDILPNKTTNITNLLFMTLLTHSKMQTLL